MTSNPRSTANPEAARRRSSRRTFGAIRRLLSGRYQARYRGPEGAEHTAPTTFARKTDADAWLATHQADLVRGTWRNPDAGAITLADYLADWLESHPVAPRTRENYRRAADRWLTRDLHRPATTARAARVLNLGSYQLRQLTPAVVRDWYATADADQRAGVLERQHSAERTRRARQSTGDARWWARANGHTVADSGRLPAAMLAAMLAAWHAAGSPTRPDLELTLERQHVAQVVASAYRVLRACLNTAMRDGLIVANPCQIPRVGDGRAAERVPATPAQLDALAAAMPAYLATAVHVAAWSGLRAGGLFALAREHIDLAAKHGQSHPRPARARRRTDPIRPTQDALEFSHCRTGAARPADPRRPP